MTATAVAMLRSLPDVIAEYDAKVANIDAAIVAFDQAGTALKSAASVGGTWGQVHLDIGHGHSTTLAEALLKSAWLHVWNGLSLDQIASAQDKQNWARAMTSPAPFTLANIRATLGYYIENPRANILRGLAEVFAGLDPIFKSHEKMKIGVKGLPKRVIITGLGAFGASYAEDKLRDILNAVAAVRGQPIVERVEISAILKHGEALRDGGTWPSPYNSRYEDKTVDLPARDVWLKRFANGNGHLFFGPAALHAINSGLAEYYGDVLADCVVDEDQKPMASTAVSRDLQYYPTPVSVAQKIVQRINIVGARVLDPSCGCGRLLDAARWGGATCFGIEVDRGRVEQARLKRHQVVQGNFLEQQPAGQWANFHVVLMNPPFYGKHYAKHVLHALKFLKPGGRLIAILPATARYDHGLLDHLHPYWHDLPVGAFAESGTNICTTVCNIIKSEGV
jgi:hypothetical protein